MDRLLTSLAVLLFTPTFFSETVVQSREFTIVNNCRSTIWPGIRTTAGTHFAPTGFILNTNESKILSVPESWSGRVWGRTYCSMNTSTGNFSCLTGDCGSGKLECAGGSNGIPSTLFEFSLNLTGGMDFYDVSLVDGFNLPMTVAAEGGKSGQCNSTGCSVDLNDNCPRELRVARENGSWSETLACSSACSTFVNPLFCCVEGYAGPEKCSPTLYSKYFKDACPLAFSYAYDDKTSTFSCASADYTIIFCPSTHTVQGFEYFVVDLVEYSFISGPAPSPSDGAFAPMPTGSPADPIPTKRSRNWIRFSLSAIAILLVLLASLGLFWHWQRRNGCPQAMSRMTGVQSWKPRDNGDEDSVLFSFATIEIATNHFSDENFLGQGGYGPVYKGKLHNGQEIAVKRLQKMSGHGMEQFKNEVTVISKLQHRNLVRLLGYCSDNNERILVYEYLPNKSLDSILFDAEKRAILGWKSRLQIIEGIAQGLLYLHKYSRLKIIHRDLKTGNILLDNDLNPKISDFGTAKIFGENELCASTNRIIGTYGYMSPEYAMDGIFSVKSDVFSFGVIMLEIISGKKNTAFYNSDRHINLLGYVWDLLIGERVSEIIDPNLVETISIGEVVHYVQVGLLCVQENAADRPTMSSVVSMLQNQSMSLPAPKQPSFATILRPTNANLCENLVPASVNKLTISDVEGR